VVVKVGGESEAAVGENGNLQSQWVWNLKEQCVKMGSGGQSG